MKDNEKQIKLLTKRISKIQNKGVKDIPNFTNVFINNQELAEELLKHYQLVDKNSVVLSKEEYGSKLQDAYDNGVQFGKKWGSKETAEKIIDLIKTFCSDKKFVEVITRIISERLGVEEV
jgi:hypothetical protein